MPEGKPYEKCKVCGTERKRLRKDGVCFKLGRSSIQCADLLCSCGGPMDEVSQINISGCSCDRYGTDVYAFQCRTCKSIKLLTG